MGGPGLAVRDVALPHTSSQLCFPFCLVGTLSQATVDPWAELGGPGGGCLIGKGSTSFWAVSALL